jgi:hypothetical protein
LTSFSVSGSDYCTASDIVYTATVTASDRQSTSFITFSADTLEILWSSPTVAGVYTVTVAGTIDNDHGEVVNYSQFILTVISCETSTNDVLIKAFKVSQINIKTNSGASSTTISEF